MISLSHGFDLFVGYTTRQVGGGGGGVGELRRIVQQQQLLWVKLEETKKLVVPFQSPPLGCRWWTPTSICMCNSTTLWMLYQSVVASAGSSQCGVLAVLALGYVVAQAKQVKACSEGGQLCGGAGWRQGRGWERKDESYHGQPLLRPLCGELKGLGSTFCHTLIRPRASKRSGGHQAPQCHGAQHLLPPLTETHNQTPLSLLHCAKHTHLLHCSYPSSFVLYRCVEVFMKMSL